MIDIENLTFHWDPKTPVLDIPNFSCAEGERIFLEGQSGSGKSTLLNLICGVFEATSGSLKILDKDFSKLSAAARDSVRAESMGVIFQQFNLVPFLSLTENVLLPGRFSKKRQQRIGTTEKERLDKAQDLLDRLGLTVEARSGRTVTALSVGQQQRVAAARALIGEPSLIIADEPTSALDHAAKEVFIETLLAEAKGATVVFVSHDPTIAAAFDRRVLMSEINKATAPAQGAGS